MHFSQLQKLFFDLKCDYIPQVSHLTIYTLQVSIVRIFVTDFQEICTTGLLRLQICISRQGGSEIALTDQRYWSLCKI